MMPRRHLDPEALRALVCIADTASFSAAAQQLGRTQSAVSLQIKRLEDSLGQPLFERLPRGVALTPRGAQLMPYARRITALLEEAALALRVKPLVGPVRVGIPDEYSGTVLPRALSAFAERHPEVEVSVRCDHSEPQLQAMDADDIDLAVIYDWSYVGEGEVLCIDPTVWATSVTHQQHLRRPLPAAVFMRSDWCRDFAERSLDQQGLPWRVAFECDDAGAMRMAVQNGLAIAPISRSTMPPGCRELTAADGFPIIDSSRVLLRRNPRGTSEAIEGMAAMLREAFRPLAERAPL